MIDLVTLVGLVFDIVGAWVMASAVIAAAKGVRQGFATEEAAQATIREASRAKWGAGTLTIGFIFQAIAVICKAYR